jgi:hypothetical protein
MWNHHHQRHHSPTNEPWPLLEFISLQDSQQISFYRVRLSASRPTPNLEDQSCVFIPPGDTVAQLYPRTLGITGASGSPLPYPLTWVPVGLHVKYGLITGGKTINCRCLREKYLDLRRMAYVRDQNIAHSRTLYFIGLHVTQHFN